MSTFQSDLFRMATIKNEDGPGTSKRRNKLPMIPKSEATPGVKEEKVFTVPTLPMGASKKRRLDTDAANIVKNPTIPKRMRYVQDVKRPDIKNIRTPQAVLLDVCRFIAEGDRPMAASFFREFISNHMSLLSVSGVQNVSGVIELLLGAAVASQYDEHTRSALQALHSILLASPSSVWQGVFDLITIHVKRLLPRFALDASLLSIAEAAVRERHMRPSELGAEFKRMMQRSILDSGDARRRVAGIQFFVTSVLGSDESDVRHFTHLQLELCRMTDDQDSRVRAASVSGLFNLAAQKQGLTTDAYETVKKMCGDSDRHVRRECLRIMHYFAEKFPDTIVKGLNDVQLPLHDDSFAAVCHALNDVEVVVRAEAAKLLGEFSRVSDSFLDQTLDRKMMKTMKTDRGEQVVNLKQSDSMFALRKQTSTKKWRWNNRGANVQKKTDTEWSTGKKLNEVAPGEVKESGEEDATTQSIIPQGACGAFVTALEDEFMAVRKAAVYSLGKLAAHRPSFATAALDHLADMFNDEIAEVRLDSIYALTPLVVHSQMEKQQLETILKCLDDAMPETRQALRALLVKGDVVDVDCVRVCVKALLLCLMRFPQDRLDIFKCMSELGKRHALMVHAMVAELLNLHPVFELQEYHINDHEYIAKVLMILGAASEHEPILSLLPAFVLRHYRYLRASNPNLVPVILSIDGAARLEADKRMQALRAEWSGERTEVIESTYARLVSVERELDPMDRSTLRRLLIDDVAAISKYNESLSGCARLVSSIAQICNAMDSSFQKLLLIGGAVREMHVQLEKDLRTVLAVLSQFSGVSSQLKSFLVECALHIMLQQVLLDMVAHPENMLKDVKRISQALAHATRLFVSEGVAPSEMAQSFMTALRQHIGVQGKGKVPMVTVGVICRLVMDQPPRLPERLSHGRDVRVKWAKITEPSGDKYLDRPIKFVAGLPTSIEFTAELHNLSDVDVERLRIMISYPDFTNELFRPRPSHITKGSPEGTHNLKTEVLLTAHASWADAAEAYLTVVLLGKAEHTSKQLTVSTSELDPIFESPAHVPLFESPARGSPARVMIKLYPMSGRC